MDLKVKAGTQFSLRMTFKDSRLDDANFAVCFLTVLRDDTFISGKLWETSTLKEVKHET